MKSDQYRIRIRREMSNFLFEKSGMFLFFGELGKIRKYSFPTKICLQKLTKVCDKSVKLTLSNMLSAFKKQSEYRYTQ